MAREWKIPALRGDVEPKWLYVKFPYNLTRWADLTKQEKADLALAHLVQITKSQQVTLDMDTLTWEVMSAYSVKENKVVIKVGAQVV